MNHIVTQIITRLSDQDARIKRDNSGCIEIYYPLMPRWSSYYVSMNELITAYKRTIEENKIEVANKIMTCLLGQ